MCSIPFSLWSSTFFRYVWKINIVHSNSKCYNLYANLFNVFILFLFIWKTLRSLILKTIICHSILTVYLLKIIGWNYWSRNCCFKFFNHVHTLLLCLYCLCLKFSFCHLIFIFYNFIFNNKSRKFSLICLKYFIAIIIVDLLHPCEIILNKLINENDMI